MIPQGLEQLPGSWLKALPAHFGRSANRTGLICHLCFANFPSLKGSS